MLEFIALAAGMLVLTLLAPPLSAVEEERIRITCGYDSMMARI